MKKLIVLAIVASFMVSSVAFAAETVNLKQKTSGALAAASKAKSLPKPPVKKVSNPIPVKKVVAYTDGVYVAYGNADLQGTGGAKVTIKNGRIADIVLMRTDATLINRDSSINYKTVVTANQLMKQKLLGKTREEIQKVDTVSGATKTSMDWKISVDRAFIRALKVKQSNATYFEGEHAGVDPQGKYAVFTTFDKTKPTAVKVYPISNGVILDERTMSAEQKKVSDAYETEIINKSLAMGSVDGYEVDYKSIYNAYWDSIQNAKVSNDLKYIDGAYSSYGDATENGAEKADIYIRNGKLVDIKLYKLGQNLADVGTTYPYEKIYDAKVQIAAKLLDKGSFLEIDSMNNQDCEGQSTGMDMDMSGGSSASMLPDVISGATESFKNWNEAVKRAFEKANKVKPINSYFDGIFAGVDSKYNIQVIAYIDSNEIISVTVSILDANKNIIAEDTLTQNQKDLIEKINTNLLKYGVKMPDIKGAESYSAAARSAFSNALANASTE